MKILFITLVIMLFALYPFSDTNAAGVTLQWDANTEPDLAGYIIYWETESHCPDNAGECEQPIKDSIYKNFKAVILSELPDKDNPTYEVKGLDNTKDYFFAVKAFDSETPQLISEYSNQVKLSANSNGPPAKPTLRSVIWKIIQAVVGAIKGGLRIVS